MAAGCILAGLIASLVLGEILPAAPLAATGAATHAATLAALAAGVALVAAVLHLARTRAAAAVIGGACLFFGLLTLAGTGAAAIRLAPEGDIYRGFASWRDVGFAAFALFHLRAATWPPGAGRGMVATAVLLGTLLAAASAAAAVDGLAPGVGGAALAAALVLPALLFGPRDAGSDRRWLCVAVLALLCGSLAGVAGDVVGDGTHVAPLFDLAAAAALVPPLLDDRAGHEARIAALAAALEREAGLDPVTGIANRRLLDRRLDEEWRRATRSGRSVSLLMVDIDHFKRVNDTYGHVAGDEVLRRIARCLTESARRGGDVVARYGGDEFAVLLPEAGAEQVAQVSERLRACVAALDVVSPNGTSAEGAPPQDAAAGSTPDGGVPAPVTVSIGTASLVPRPGRTPSDLIELADRALLAAKRGGRDRVVAA